MDAYVASLQSVHSSLAAKGDALDIVEAKVAAAQVLTFQMCISTDKLRTLAHSSFGRQGRRP